MKNEERAQRIRERYAAGPKHDHAKIAVILDDWAEELINTHRLDLPGRDPVLFGFADALQEVAVHLANGGFLPGGVFHDRMP